MNLVTKFIQTQENLKKDPCENEKQLQTPC